jgi:hypothetical protein
MEKNQKIEAEYKPDKNNIGNAGEYYIASILSSKGYTTTITLGRAETYDIIAIRPDGNTLKIQVKTAWNDNRVFRLSPKDELDKGTEYYYAFVTLKENKKPWEYYMIPAEIVSKSVREAHKKWLHTPGRNGQKHKDSSVRVFKTKPDKYCPGWLTEEKIIGYRNNIHALEEDISKY